MQTAIKQRPILFSTPMVQAILAGRKTMTRRIVKGNVPLGNWEETIKNCLYGNVGDVLWVRENFNYVDTYPEPDICGKYLYAANGDKGKMKPSIHMPYDACRLFMRITDIRVERLQDITEADSIKEGVIRDHPGGFGRSSEEWRNYVSNKTPAVSARASFYSLWESINGTGSWDNNPFVWVVSFTKIDKPE